MDQAVNLVGEVYNWLINMADKRIAFITGASHGIGRGIAQYLLEKGYFAHGSFFKDKELIEKDFKSNPNFFIHHLDVREELSVQEALKKVAETSGILHLLVNNAGVDYEVPFEEATLDRWNEIFDVRAKGTFLMTKYALPLLKKASRSTIINITSSFAHEAHANLAATSAAEAAKMSFTKSSALALAKYGIRTHSVNPGVTRTPLWDPFGVDDKGWENMAKANPLGRNCTPLDVAKVICYLDSEEAEYLNGEEIYVNGGNHLKSD